MSNILLGWPNRTDVSTISGGSWTGLSNLQNRNSYSVARSSGLLTTATQFDIDLNTTNFGIRAISLHNHNLSANALWRITVGTTAGASDVYDTGFVSVWSIQFDGDLAQFEDTAYWSELLSDTNVRSTFSIISTLSEVARSNQYFRVEINDVGNTAGYIEIGRLGVWSGFSPTINAKWGVKHGSNDLSDLSFSLGGEMSYEKRRSRKTANMSFEWLPDSEANTLSEMIRRLGTTGELLYVPNPADAAETQRYGFRGSMRKLGEMEKTTYNISSTELQIEELL
jgi:hypothetical protein